MATYKDTLELVDKVTKPLKKIQKETETLDKKLSRLSEKLKNIGGKIQSVGNKMTVGLTLPIVALGTASLKAAADFEKMQEQLSVMLGSAEKGKKMFNDITKFASQTPLETKDIMQSTNTMLSFGIASDKVLKYQRQLGDIAGGNAERFRSLSLAFSQASSAGKLQGQDLMQMINAGFNPLEQIAKRTGKTVGYWKEQMSKGKVTMEMVTQAMEDATSEGGRYYNMMQKMSKTAQGQLSTLQDNWNMTLASFGQQIMPIAIKAMQKFSELLEKFNNMSSGAKKTTVVLLGFVAIIGPLVSGIGTLITVIGGVNAALAFLAANPVVLVIAGIVALITVIVLLIKNWDKVTKAAKKWADWMTGSTLGKVLSVMFPFVGILAAIIKNWDKIKEVAGNAISGLIQWVQKAITWVSNLLDKLGAVASIIPGLNAIGIAGAIHNNRVNQTQNNYYNTNNSTVNNNRNNIYNNPYMTPIVNVP